MRSAVPFLLLLTACAGTTQPRFAAGPLLTDTDVRAVIRRALEADAAGQAADTLYAAGATIVANGRVRLSPPRFAGVARGGAVTIQNVSAELSATVAWGSARYRWAPPPQGGGNVEAGEATFVLQRTDRGWQIVHAHSSLPLPWDPSR